MITALYSIVTVILLYYLFFVQYSTDIINNCDLFFIAHFFTMCPSSPRFVFIIPTCALNRIKPHPSKHSIIYNIMLLFIYYYLLGISSWAKFAIRPFNGMFATIASSGYGESTDSFVSKNNPFFIPFLWPKFHFHWSEKRLFFRNVPYFITEFKKTAKNKWLQFLPIVSTTISLFMKRVISTDGNDRNFGLNGHKKGHFKEKMAFVMTGLDGHKKVYERS